MLEHSGGSFFVTAYPRSRTRWLAAFLDAEHEPTSRAHSLAGLWGVLDSGGHVDSSFAAVPEILERYRHRPWAVIRRPFDEVRASLDRLPWAGPGAADRIAWIGDFLDAASVLPNARTLPYAGLDDPDTLAALWHHLRGTTMPPERLALRGHRIDLTHGEVPSATAWAMGRLRRRLP